MSPAAQVELSRYTAQHTRRDTGCTENHPPSGHTVRSPNRCSFCDPATNFGGQIISNTTRVEHSVCLATENLPVINEHEIARDHDKYSSLTNLFQVDNLSPGNYSDPYLENYFVPENPNTVADNVTFAEHISVDSNRFTSRHAHFGRRHTPYTMYAGNIHTRRPLMNFHMITRRSLGVHSLHP